MPDKETHFTHRKKQYGTSETHNGNTFVAHSSKIGKYCCDTLASWSSLKALSPVQLRHAVPTPHPNKKLKLKLKLKKLKTISV